MLQSAPTLIDTWQTGAERRHDIRLSDTGPHLPGQREGNCRFDQALNFGAAEVLGAPGQVVAAQVEFESIV